MDRFTPITIALFVCLMAPGAARGQAVGEAPIQAGVRAQVAVSSIYDDNILSRPTPTADLVWRLSPAMMAQRKSARLTIATFATVDADVFRDNHELSTPLAGARGSFDFTAKATPQTILAFRADAESTMNPTDLNLTTGLVTERMRAWGWRAGPELRRAVTPSATIGIRYQFTRQVFSSVDVQTHETSIWLSRQLGPRNAIRLKSESQLFLFDPDTRVGSETVILGLARRLTDTIAMNVDGGARYTLGAIRPELLATVAHAGRTRDFTLGYTVSHSTAFGVPVLVAVQSVQGGVAYHPSRRSRAAVHGTAFVNTIESSSVRVYRLTASIARPLAGPVSFTIDYTRNFQRGDERIPQPEAQVIERNTLSIGIVVFSLAAR